MTKFAVVGVMESTGREILSLLAENGVSTSDVFALEPNCSIGHQVSYGEDDDLDVQRLDEFDFHQTNGVFFACSADVTQKYIGKAVLAQNKVVDLSGASLSQTTVPMIVAGLNDFAVKEAQNVVTIPSALTTQILLALSQVNQQFPLVKLVVTAFASTSVYGKPAMDELFNQTRKIFMNASLVDDEQVFQKQIAFNVLPQVGKFIGEETEFEWLINAEVKKVLGGNLKVHANAAFVPAFIGLGAFVNVQTAVEPNLDAVRNLISNTDGVVLFDKQVDGGYVSLNDVQGEDSVYVSRLRQDLSLPNGFSFWCTADNLRATTAQNAFRVMKLIFSK